jgi:hypothetical protein
MYDGSAGQWRALPDMSVARNACAAVCIEGNVYVVGGYYDGFHLKSASMRAARWLCAAAVGEMGPTPG